MKSFGESGQSEYVSTGKDGGTPAASGRSVLERSAGARGSAGSARLVHQPSESRQQNSPRQVVQRRRLQTLMQEPQGVKSVRASASGHLPDNLKSGIESLSGLSMDAVQVHYNSAKPAQLNALAYAQGNEIHLGPNQEQHLPHEAWHVVQQKQGRVKPTVQTKSGVGVNDDKGLEREADVMGQRALSTIDRSTSKKRPTQLRSNSPPSNAAGTPVIQCLMTSAQLAATYGVGAAADPFIVAISQTLDQFHADSAPLIPLPGRRQAFSDRRLRQLDQIEHSVYTWLDQNRAAATGAGHRGTFEGLMDEIQEAHRTHIDYIHDHDLSLWTPDRAGLGAAAAGQLDADWDSLRNRTGNMAITDTSPAFGDGEHPAHRHGTFHGEMRAIHARLLSRPQGRALMRQLLAGTGAIGAGGVAAGNQVSIQPYHPEMGMPGAEANATHQASALATVGVGGGYGAPTGANSASLVGMEAGMRDSANTNPDAMGAAANLASPAFIVYAHEMIHALHNLQGDNRRNISVASYAAGGIHHGWSNEEERTTISSALGISENAMRAEHGLLTPRVGHF